jgi:hypothetical protein
MNQVSQFCKVVADLLCQRFVISYSESLGVWKDFYR